LAEMRRSAKWSVGRTESFRDGDDCIGSEHVYRPLPVGSRYGVYRQ
jgi:hypothetical protein